MRQRGLRRASAFSLPRRLWRGDVLRCVDLHCGGEPATVVLGKDVPGATMEEKRQHIMRHEDAWRRLLLHARSARLRRRREAAERARRRWRWWSRRRRRDRME